VLGSATRPEVGQTERTGAPAQLPWTLGFAALFLVVGSALISLAGVVGSALIFLAGGPEAARLPSSDLS
jgi:hypothetical protein